MRSNTQRSFEQGMFCNILSITFEENTKIRGHKLSETHNKANLFCRDNLQKV